jgi:hypothetical protein
MGCAVAVNGNDSLADNAGITAIRAISSNGGATASAGPSMGARRAGWHRRPGSRATDCPGSQRRTARDQPEGHGSDMSHLLR